MPPMDGDTSGPYHSKNTEEVLRQFNTTKEGLTDKEAKERLKQYGYNELTQKKQKPILIMLKEQLTDVMVLILITAALISIFLGEYTEAIVIGIIVLLDAFIGIIQEKKANDAINALKNMSSPTARVLREFEESIISTKELVPGDIVFIEDGNIVPADIRLIESSNLKIEEASLTGESVPSEKDADADVPENAVLADRTNMAYSSSTVSYGNGIGIVTSTGMNTEVGKIASMLDSENELETPLKQKLNAVGKKLSVVGIFVCILIFIIGFLYGKPLIPLLMTAISLAISIIPEGLPATATIVMALGVQRMAEKNALIRKLPAVETLGSASVICCDKTGTLTQNKMTVTEIAMNGDFEEGKAISVDNIQKHDNIYKELIYAGALCNKACLNPDKEGEILGDPTEGALIFLAEKYGIIQEELEDKYPQEFEQPFDSDRKMMTTVHNIDGVIKAYTKGAVDELVPLCTKILTKNGIRDITNKDKENIRNLCNSMQERALRVLGFAMKTLSKIPEDEENVEFDLTFIGITGMIDPPRLEVIDAVKVCHDAGIKVIMITGDHKITALAIAKELGIYKKGNTIITGDELDVLSDKELDEKVKTTTVFARVSPSDKLRIIDSLKRIGEIVSMTGDGVNDAPALKSANIGIAMGKSGTDVAKDSADMILMNDNFTTIESAIREGRRIYQNIQKVIQFLLAGNIAEILIIFIATLLNWEAPILAVHILLINLITDTLPALALGIDPADKNIMSRKPNRQNSLFDKGLIMRVCSQGVFISISTLIGYFYGLTRFNTKTAMTMAFLILASSQLFHALNQRSNIDSVFTKYKEHNKMLFLAMIASFLMLIIILLIPSLRNFFSLTVLNINQILIALILSVLPLFEVEIIKLFKRKIRG